MTLHACFPKEINGGCNTQSYFRYYFYNMGYLWKNMQSPMNPACSAPFKHSDGEAHMKVCEAEPACMATIATCSFTDVPLFTKTQHCSKHAQPINTHSNPKQRKVLLHMRLNDSCHPTKTLYWSDQTARLIIILDVTACYSKKHMLKLYSRSI